MTRPDAPRATQPGLAVGIDAGGTKTLALAAGFDGVVLGAGRTGPGNIYEDEAWAEQAILTAVDAALEQAGGSRAAVRALTLSTTGADWPEDFEFFQEMLRPAFEGASITVLNDALGALFAGSPQGWGVVIACGTGTGVAARSPGGEVWHSSFWQAPAGGALDLGRDAHQAAYQAELGLIPPTSLQAGLMALYDQPDIEAILHGLTGRAHALKSRAGGAARVLLDAAHDGDAAAVAIVRRHAECLAEFALLAARRVGLAGETFPLVLAGGVFHHPSSVLRDAIEKRVTRASPGARPVEDSLEPVAGALLHALSVAAPIAGGLVAPDVRQAVKDSVPGAAFYDSLPGPG